MKDMKKKSKSMGLFGTSDDDSRHSTGLSKKSDEKKHIGSESDDDASNILRKSPRRSSGHRKKQTSTDSESETEVPSKQHKNHLKEELTKKNLKKSSISDSDDEPEILSSTLKSKTKILTEENKKLLESESNFLDYGDKLGDLFVSSNKNTLSEPDERYESTEEVQNVAVQWV